MQIVDHFGTIWKTLSSTSINQSINQSIHVSIKRDFYLPERRYPPVQLFSHVWRVCHLYHFTWDWLWIEMGSRTICEFCYSIAYFATFTLKGDFWRRNRALEGEQFGFRGWIGTSKENLHFDKVNKLFSFFSLAVFSRRNRKPVCRVSIKF